MLEKSVLVVIGTGGMGMAIARRLGTGRRLVLGDVDPNRLADLEARLGGEGYDVTTRQIDVASAASVSGFASYAAGQGQITSVAHTAGVSPAGAPVQAVLEIDLLGTALVLDAFGAVVADGGAGVFIASMAGHLAGNLGEVAERELATVASSELLSLPLFAAPAIQKNAAWAYMVAKRGSQIRVRAAASPWGLRGARVNSISPGVISTPMGLQELSGEAGSAIQDLVDNSAARRPGTPEDIAAAAEFLLDPRAGFITGTDLLVDGGVVASTYPG
jgi:NAD(P)-dependent dehydrogenase (short-subunit alcohol dehydrogenase family)